MNARARRSHSSRGERREPAQSLRESIQRFKPHIAEPNLDSTTFLEWSTAVPEPKGPLDFARFPFQRELYSVLGDAAYKDVVVMKGTQVGVSALLARLALFYASSGLTALYVFPARRQMEDFSDTRIEPLLRFFSSSAREAEIQNKGLKSVGSGLVYLRGSESKRDLLAVDADLLVLDEYDALTTQNVPDAESRISASRLGLIRRVGVPSQLNGIAALYDRSDRRRWVVRCDACAEHQPIDFFQNVKWNEGADGEIRDARLVCRHCLSSLDVTQGGWEAECPERTRPGFHVHRLLIPGTNLVSIIEASKRTEPYAAESFSINDLGLPHTSESTGLDADAIAAAVSLGESYDGSPNLMVGGYAGPNLVTMGVDVASTRSLNVRISEHLDDLMEPRHRKRALFIGLAASFEELAELINRYNVRFACIDHLPEYRLAAGLAERFAGRVFLVNYSPNQLESIEFHAETRRVSVRRDAAFDATVELIRAGRNLLAKDLPDQYVAQMLRPRRAVTEDRYGRRAPKWEERGATDYFHAEVYDLIATEKAKHALVSAELARQQIVALTEQQLSRVNDYEDMTYRPGPALSLGGYFDEIDYPDWQLTEAQWFW